MSGRNRHLSDWRRRWLPSLPLSATVFCFWLLMNDQVSSGHVVMALVLAVLIPAFAARLDREFARVGRLRGIPKMFAVLALDIVRSNIIVALQVLGREEKITPGFVWIPLDIANIHGIAALTSIITLTPGTVSSALSDDRRYLLVHVLHLEDADEVVRQIKTRYEKPLMEIFPVTPQALVAFAIVAAMHLVGLAMLLALYRLLKGPSVPDRILALDTLFVAAIAQLILFGMHLGTAVYFEAALVIAMLGFVGTVVLSKYVLRRDIVE